MDSQTMPPVAVLFDYTPAINFALQQNHVPVIRELIIKNQSPTDWQNVMVKVTAEPDFATIWQQDIGALLIGQSHGFKNISLTISSKFLAELTERLSGKFILTISNGDQLLYQEHYRVDLLAYDQWNGIGLLPEMLVAFVTPNHPEIVKIIRNASDILEKWTGNPSFDEYQSRNPDRVRKQMAAIYEAIAAMQFIYCSLPASFEESGQRIRLADAIFSNKLANCLDLSLLYAACLEAVGIHPILTIIKGHAFVGGWLIDESFADAVNDDPSLITKRTADGINDIVVMESTCMIAGNNASFDEAVKSADQKMMRTSDFSLFIDVKRARFSGIRPLPLRVATTTGWEIVEDVKRQRENELPGEIFVGQKLGYADKINVSKQRLWERKLLDLTLRNSLLNIRMTKSVIQFITINAGKLEDALASGTEFQVLAKPSDWDNNPRDTGIYESLHQSDPIADLVTNELGHKRLRTFLSEIELNNSITALYRSSRLSLEENGANTLYVGLGMLRWYETDLSERPRYAPILLLPVEIIRKSAQKGYLIRSREEETIMNITLLEMIRQDFGITIGGLESLPKDESGVDVKLIFNIIRQAIMAKSRWDVEEQAVLGTFSFSKFILWNDIHHNADKLARNKVVASLISGQLEWQPEEDNSVMAIDDGQLHPKNVALPISSDSSQLKAILASGEGKSFVLHGPPGTGKSQTITNIIANALSAGKKVLFVAAKKAALDVVESRLEAIGIGDFCLELHSNKSKKTAVLQQLKAATEIVQKDAPANFASEADRLYSLRNELNTYVAALHEKYPFGYSLFELFTEYSRLPRVNNSIIFPTETIQTLTPDHLIIWRDVINELQAAGTLITSPKGHPLEAIRINQYTLQIKNEARKSIEELLALLVSANDQSDIVSDVLKVGGLVKSRKQQDGLMLLAGVASQLEDLPASLIQVDAPEQNLAQIIGVAAHGKRRDVLRSDLLNKFQKDILTFPASETLYEWNAAAEKWFLPRWLKQKALLKTVNRLSLTGIVSAQEAPGVFQRIISYQNEQGIIDKATWLPPMLGFLWQNGECNWERIAKSCDQIIALNRAAGQITSTADLRNWRLQLASEFTEGTKAYMIQHEAILGDYLQSANRITRVETELQALLGINFGRLTEQFADWNTELRHLASGWLQHLESLKDWYNWLAVKERAVSTGLQPLVTAFENGVITSGLITQEFERGFYRSGAEYIIERTPQLATFNSDLFEEKIKRFKAISTNFENLTKQELYARLASRIPIFTQEASQSSEIGMLQRTIRNNGRAMSIRKIFDGIPNLLHRLTPCMLMSPISVAQYFDADSVKFDLVVFDEASQMPTCEAVGAIARGTTVIVVGDPKQMPPTNFFATNNIDEEHIDKEDLESILDDCLALSMPSHHLLWHYRSKHESLIAFSNAKYYDNKLLTFPSTDDIVSKVQFVKVEGFYDKGKSRQNKFEARAIVDEVVFRLSDPVLALKSIGIVTFSSVQQTLVEDLLTEVFKIRPDLERIALESAEPIFIKNLENVQGDERDVILFSIGYGADENGKVGLNFGPINRDGGWRRLNVAVSRARYEMKVFSTLTSDQIDLNRTASEGVAGLKAFLSYAEKGKIALPLRQITKNDQGPSFENLIALELRDQGYIVHTQIGCSAYKIDLGIVDKDNPSGYILGVLTDGHSYHNAKTSRDREIVQVDVLKGLGWKIHKIYATEWWEKPEKVFAGIVAAIRHAEENKLAAAADITNTTQPAVPEVFKSGSEVTPPFVTPKVSLPSHVFYEIAQLDAVQIQTAEDFFLPQSRGRIKAQLFNVLQAEAPISANLLSKRILSAWGISRLTSRVTLHLEGFFAGINANQTFAGQNVFYWNKDQQPGLYKTYRIPANDAQKRDADDLPPEEVANAMQAILKNQISLNKADLVREAAKVFGYARLGINVESSMLRGIEKAIETGHAHPKNDRIVHSGS
ncbi:DNA helicase [Mucilaginibacter sp. PAMC 26640]|nr:DNA helicase [Mucilaginibacter sp. PAMC 26640]